MNIRKATLNDIEELIEVKLECWEHTYRPIFDKGQLDAFLSEDINHLYIRSTIECFQMYILEMDEKIVGYVTYDLSSEQNVFLYELYIVPDYQGKGLGKTCISILEYMEPEAESIALEVVVNNHNAIEFYKRIGFVEESCYIHEGPIDTAVYKMIKSINRKIVTPLNNKTEIYSLV